MINGDTQLIAHIGYPTHSFKSPLIYNPYFEERGINAVVVPMGCQATAYPMLLQAVFQLSNIAGALITMPHKVTTVELLDEMSDTVRAAGACNAVKRLPDGRLFGEMFDGEGFVRGLRRKGVVLQGQRALLVGAGGVGCAIAASLAGAGVGALSLFDLRAESAEQLAQRILRTYPGVELRTGSNDPSAHDIVVNATPMGMNEGDPLPVDVTRISPLAFVAEVVMRKETTAFLAAAQARGCRTQVGADMLFEQIPAYLEFFGLPSTTAEHLRQVARLSYPELQEVSHVAA
jgi:shikimate dehydrogenase